MTDPKLSLVPTAPAATKPLIKWAGGKRWFVERFGDDLYTEAVSAGGFYFEPFLGGGAMALHLGLRGMMLGDALEELVTMYKVVRDDPMGLSAMLRLLAEYGTDEKSYYHVREQKTHTDVEAAAKLIYLNKLCYNGLYRKNKSGGFNVPYGKEQRALPNPEQICDASSALKGASLRAGDFAALVSEASKGDTVYADPPYQGTFSDYTANGFSDQDHERLAEALYEAHQRGASVYCHNVDTKLVRWLYEEWAEIIPMVEKRNINSKGDERGRVSCVFIAGVQT